MIITHFERIAVNNLFKMSVLFIFVTIINLTIYKIADAKLVECDENFVTLTDFNSAQCGKNYYFVKSINESCVPGCVHLQGLGEECDEFKTCAPGLKCDECKTRAPGLKSDGNNCLCVLDEATCSKYNFLISTWIPDCLPDGTFAAKQCKGEMQNGRCYCYGPFGERIFGEMWSNRAENMTCACSRHRNALERAGRNDVTLHCDSMGNYESLQCDSGSCWCTEPKTGEVLDTVVPESMMKLLPCYDSKKIGSQYLRQCESQLFAQARIKNEFLSRGTNCVNLPFLLCGYDGSFGRYKVEKGVLFCTWRDNSLLGYEISRIDSKTLDCNCALDHQIYKLDGKTLTKVCNGDGSYRILQEFEGTSKYCVDQDGFMTLGPDESLTVETCPSWDSLP